MRKEVKKAPVRKATKTATPRITMTVNQALTIKKALGKKSYAFLDKKINEVSND